MKIKKNKNQIEIKLRIVGFLLMLKWISFLGRIERDEDTGGKRASTPAAQVSSFFQQQTRQRLYTGLCYLHQLSITLLCIILLFPYLLRSLLFAQC